ncbi:hypothetical protein BASA61_005065 [Batrachochytrium salamandrivorans]|nr:hypothetical protein BASA61_005065 [Batrachochytrium salamandrivorans]
MRSTLLSAHAAAYSPFMAYTTQATMQSLSIKTSQRGFLLGLLGQIHPSGAQQLKLQQYKERRIIGYSQQQMCALVADIDKYHCFVPWCTASHILHPRPPSKPLLKSPLQDLTNSTTLTAELHVGFQTFSESYISTVTCMHPVSVKAVASDSAIFKTLINEWNFSPIPATHALPPTKHNSTDAQSCVIDFYVGFEFRHAVYAQASSLFIDQVSKMMVTAFADRAREVYGPPARPSIKLA